MWVYTIVGIPAFYFGFDTSVLGKILIFFVVSIVFFIPLFFLTVIIHHKSFKTDEDIERFNALSDSGKGKIIGEYWSP